MRRLLPYVVLLFALLPAAPAGAITGGTPASEEYPWMVSLQLDGDAYCGASLMRADWILTAAHCVDGNEPERYTAVLGRHDLTTSDGEEIPVDRIVVHEAYEGDGYDVALLHLARGSAATPLRLVGLSEGALWAADAPARVIGWGSSVFLVGPGSDDLMEVDVPMVSDDDCDTSYNGLSPFSYDPDTMVCAGETTGTKDSCQGDSGGPLVVKDGASAWTQVGVVSFGLGCGFPLYYGVYARVGGPTLNNWITSHLPPVGAAPAPVPAAPAPSGGGGGGGGGPTPAGGGSNAPAASARLNFATKLGSARKAKRAKVLRLRLNSTGRITGVRATLKRGRRAIARGHVAVVEGRAVMLLPIRPKAAKPGRVTVSLTGMAADGHQVSRKGAARLSR